MKRRMGLAFALAACLAVEAAEPVPSAPPAKPAAAAPVAPATKPPQVKKPLDLRIGDVRKYMMPDEYSDALNAPDADKNTVVVEGRRELLPMKSEQPVPGGIMAPFWMLAHPLNAWRTLVPDYQHQPKDEEREPADKVPPPIFRWGP